MLATCKTTMGISKVIVFGWPSNRLAMEISTVKTILRNIFYGIFLVTQNDHGNFQRHLSKCKHHGNLQRHFRKIIFI